MKTIDNLKDIIKNSKVSEMALMKATNEFKESLDFETKLDSFSTDVEIEILKEFRDQLSARGISAATATRIGNEAKLQEAYSHTMYNMYANYSTDKPRKRIRDYSSIYNAIQMTARLTEMSKNKLMSA